MNPWTPTVNVNVDGCAWWPQPSPDGHRGDHGNGRDYTYDIDTNEEGQITDPASIRVQSGGWLDEDTRIYTVGEADATVWARTPTGDYALARGVNISRAPSAGHGHWAHAYADDSRVFYDGRCIDQGHVGYLISCDGVWVAVRGNDGVHIYQDGQFVRTIPFAANTSCETPSAYHEGVIGYAYNCAPQMWDGLGTEWKDISVTPKRKESCPRFVRLPDGVLWVATSSEDYGVLVRPAVKDEACIVVALPFVPSDCRLNYDGTQFVVTAWNSAGKLIVVGVDPSSPRQKLAAPEPPPPGPDPVIAPFGRRVRNGCYYRDTYTDQRIVNGRIDAQGADCPGNVTWCVSGEPRAALTADKDALTGQPVGLIVGDDAISILAVTPGYWERIEAIYLSPESAANPLDAVLKQIGDVQHRCAYYGKPCPPIIPYIGLNDTVLAALDGCGADIWFPVQLYINGTQGPDDMRALADSLHAVVGSRQVALICQAFARWTGRTPDTAAFKGDLTALMPVYVDVVRAWGEQIEAVGFFSWRRQGGVLDYTALKPWLRAFARACEG